MATHSSTLAWRIPGTGAWWAAVYGVAQSRTRLKQLSSSSSSSIPFLAGTTLEMQIWTRGSCLKRTFYNCVLLLLLRLLLLLKSLQSCLTLCDPIDGSPPGSPFPGILQARTLEWVAISFSSAWKRKVKVKSLSHVRLLATPWTAAHQAPPSMGFSRQEYWSGAPLHSPYNCVHVFRKNQQLEVAGAVFQPCSVLNSWLWDMGSPWFLDSPF